MRAPFASPLRLRDYGIAGLLLAALADFLFFGVLHEAIGLSVPIFVTVLALATALCNHRTIRRSSSIPALLLTGSLLALIEAVNATSLGIAFLCLAGFALASVGRLPAGLEAMGGVLRFSAFVSFALIDDSVRSRRASDRLRDSSKSSAGKVLAWMVWIMPVTLALGFLLLLGSGNPILGRWLAAIDLYALLQLLDPLRLIFWTLVLGAVWPFLRPRLRRSSPDPVPSAPVSSASKAPPSPPFASLFGPGAILRALLLFNVVFAVQTLLDATYLWGGAELPDGIGYAAYAHRGAYTLVATALLAAVFVLVALRPGTPAAADRRIRVLVCLWIAQNVVLVLSSMLRLDLYVDVYALTRMRLAAFLWMALVAVGLVLIVVRIVRERSNRWLVGANLGAAAAMLSATCFVDTDAIIARFNVEHSREVSGQGIRLDLRHLESLGPSAIPAIDTLVTVLDERIGPRSIRESDLRADVNKARGELVQRHWHATRDWRSWTFRKWRLSRYLKENGTPELGEPLLYGLQG